MSAELDRADKILVQLGHFESRASAQAAIAAGQVKVAGHTLKKASQKISIHARIDAEPAHPYVSRAGLKLAHALETFAIDVSGKTCLDIGASTGGFSQVLILSGAKSVTAVDVGHDQLHPKLRTDARIHDLEGKDARQLTRAELTPAPHLIVCDASFISLHKLLTVPLSLAAPDSDLLCLFKPQFEVGRAHIGKGGIVTDTAATRDAEDRFIAWLAQHGWTACGQIDSPITGGDGNAERLIWAQRKGP